MPRFYFDARADHVFIEDDEGVELPDLTAVEREALEVVANIGRDKIRTGSCAVTIEVRTEDRRRVLAATVSLHVERDESRPH